MTIAWTGRDYRPANTQSIHRRDSRLVCYDARNAPSYRDTRRKFDLFASNLNPPNDFCKEKPLFTLKQGPAGQQWVLGHFKAIKRIDHIKNIQRCQCWTARWFLNYPFLAIKKQVTDRPTIRPTDQTSGEPKKDGWNHLKTGLRKMFAEDRRTDGRTTPLVV